MSHAIDPAALPSYATTPVIPSTNADWSVQQAVAVVTGKRNNLWESEPFCAKSRPKRYWSFAALVAPLLSDLFGSNAESVAATSRFCVQGPESVGEKAQNWGKWVRTRV